MDVSLIHMIIDGDFLLNEIKDNLINLGMSWLSSIQLKPLGHFLQSNSAYMVISQIISLVVVLAFVFISDTDVELDTGLDH